MIPRPSGADRWVPCPGSLKMESRHPDTETEAARNGTAEHNLAAACLISATSGCDSNAATSVGGLDNETGVFTTDDMAENVQVYIDDVLATAELYGVTGTLQIEQPVDCKHILRGMGGTPDARLSLPLEKKLIIWDYKSGWRVVNPDSWQLVCYAVGTLAELFDRGVDIPEIIELRVVQPRPFHALGQIRSVSLTVPRLVEKTKTLTAAAKEAVGANPLCHPGTHCVNCRASYDCPALHAAALSMIDYAATAEPESLDGAAIAVQLKMLETAADLLKARKNGLEEHAISEIKAGRTVGTLGLTQGYGRQKWKGDAKQIAVVGDLYGADIRKKDELITPKQAISKGVDADFVKQYSETPLGALKLIDNAELAAKVFLRKES